MSDYKYGEEGELQVQRAHRTSGCFPLSIYLSIYLSLSVLYSLWTAGLQCEEGVVSFTCVQVFSDRSLVTFLLETSILLFFPIIFDMDDLYRLQHEGISISGANAAAATIDFRRSVENSNVYRFESVETEAGMSDLIKSQIVNHPRYPNLVSAYIECRKVASMLLSPVAFKALFFFLFFISSVSSLLFDFFFLFLPVLPFAGRSAARNGVAAGRNRPRESTDEQSQRRNWCRSRTRRVHGIYLEN